MEGTRIQPNTKKLLERLDNDLLELKGADVLGDSDKGALEEFLRHCDLVKFAKHDPTQSQNERTLELVRNFIEKTRSDQNQVDVTGQALKSGKFAGCITTL